MKYRLLHHSLVTDVACRQLHVCRGILLCGRELGASKAHRIIRKREEDTSVDIGCRFRADTPIADSDKTGSRQVLLTKVLLRRATGGPPHYPYDER